MSRTTPGPGQGSLFELASDAAALEDAVLDETVRDDAVRDEAVVDEAATVEVVEVADDGVVVPFRRPGARIADEPEELEDLDLTVDSGLVVPPPPAPAVASASGSAPPAGPAAATRPRRASGPADHALAVLAPWRDAGVLGPSDVHLAAALARLAGLGAGPDGELDDEETAVVLAAALAARAPRLGHVCLDLATLHLSVPAEVEGDADTEAAAALDALPWPADVEAWRGAVAGSPLVTVLEPGVELSTAGPEGRPLVLDGTLLYLERYRVHEDRVAAELLRRATSAPTPSATTTDHDALFDVLGSSAQQRAAAEAGAAGLLSVIVGGPGTGKTTTVAALLALLLADAPASHIALVAPTGKAAARMGESITALAAGLATSGVAGAERLAARLAEAEISTVHRRLGYRPDGTFRHDARNPLVHDVVIVDETSMVSLPLMARLLDAVRPDARLVLVGDPGQLASVEAGSVLGDIAGPAVDAASTGAPAPVGALAGCVSVLTESYRFPGASPVGRLADAVRIGDADTALAVLAATAEAVVHRPDLGGPADADADPTGGPADDATPPEGVALRWARSGADTAAGAEAIAASALGGARRTMTAADAGDAEGALDALGRVRVLCAHRRGPFGVAWWNQQFEDWLAGDGARLAGSYVGRPVLVTANDAIKDLYNGDLGVVVRHEGAASVAFPGADGPRFVAPARVDAAETVHAMTIHKSQGSEFDEVVVVLPPAESRLATRELLYTAVTRARHVVTLVGGEDTLRRAIANRVVRQTGLRTRLWGTTGLSGPA